MTGALAAFKKSVIEEIGDFDGEVKGEDLDYSLRIKAMGYKVVYNDKAVCISEGPATYKMLLKQRMRWKYCYLLCMFKHKYLILSTKKENRLIGLLELPLSFFYVFETAIYPLLLLILIVTLIIHPLTIIPIVIFNFVFPLIIFSTIKERQKINLKEIIRLVTIPVCFGLMSFVESHAFWIVFFRMLKGEGVNWDKIQRVGLS